MISQQELLFEKEKGAIIVDIRPKGEYEAGHIKDAVNVSLFRLITGEHFILIDMCNEEQLHYGTL